MAVVALESHPLHCVLRIQYREFGPQLAVLDSAASTVSPTLPLPLEHEAAHSVDQVLGIRVQLDAHTERKRAKGLDGSNKLHF